ncbi:SURF1 family protein [Thiothrix subterranea]|uniref:SURF1-like protein n=1 Tax=Thiothrix subterranea TaxID=2735563 RepID=A0AA51R621_9GAMM|nr:SURF1 family protein [Thiothrix subterranea]WML88430.1 SURF1 family protein [Thiothrix subterranea]
MRNLGLLQQGENASITARYRFQPSVFTTLLTLLLVGIFAALSVWQYQRAAYKTQMAQAVMQQTAQAPLNLNETSVDWPAQRFRPATVSGYWEAANTVLLDNSVHQGKAGYHVITPLRLADGQHLLVNRGWIAVGADRQVLPSIPTPTDGVTLTGTLESPRSKPVFLFGEMAADTEGNQRWLYLDMAHFAHKLGHSLAPYVLLQTSESADGLRRDWPAYSNTAGMHIGYSIQWGAFGLIVLSAYVSLNLRKYPSVTSKETL